MRGIYLHINSWKKILRGCFLFGSFCFLFFFLRPQYVHVYKIMVEVLSSSDSEVLLLHVPFWKTELS